ncbi:hypothetical protein OPQ81_003238 [Rhizoctonia solani]|nr:hypothetical protein OPQ81_003238 [Rhizoctonia solani]
MRIAAVRVDAQPQVVILLSKDPRRPQETSPVSWEIRDFAENTLLSSPSRFLTSPTLLGFPCDARHSITSEALATSAPITNANSHPTDGCWNPFVCQTVIPAVCNHWRKVALDTIALWTKITLSDPAPWRFSELCLARAGPTALLDINVDMGEGFWDATENGTLEELAERAENAFAFILKHGGLPSRWRTFSMVTDVFHAQLAAMKFLAKSRFPSLVLLEMRFTGPYEFDDEDELELGKAIHSRPKLLFKESPPLLHTTSLEGIPVSYLFGHPSHPQFVGLRHLELRFEGLYPQLADLNKMLAANPNLETLKLDSDTTDEPVKVDRKKLPKVQLPKLQSLSFVSVASTIWTLQTITMLDVPNLTSFELILGILSHEYHREQVGIRKLLDYITGATNQENPLGFENDIVAVLAAYPRITKLYLPICPGLSPLLKRPWLVPNLEVLRAGVRNLVQLKKVANLRGRARLPLRTVLVDHLELEVEIKPSDRAQLRNSDLNRVASLTNLSFMGSDTVCLNTILWVVVCFS